MQLISVQLQGTVRPGASSGTINTTYPYNASTIFTITTYLYVPVCHLVQSNGLVDPLE